MPKFRTLFKNRNFVFYSVGQAFSQFGDRLVQIVLIGLVYKRWPGSTFQLAKLLFFTVLPSFFISPIAGVYVDRWNKKYVLIASDLFRALAILLVPFFFIYRESIVPLYIAIFLIFASACFFLPARLAVIPDLVDRKDLLLANSASSIIWVASGIAGFSLGAFLAELVGIRNSLFINSIVYGLSAASFAVLAYAIRRHKSWEEPKEKTKSIKKVLQKSFYHDLKEGLKTILFDKKINFVIYLFFLLSSIFGAFYVVAVVFIQEILKSMTKYIGIFGMCFFIGVLVGSYIYGKIGQKLPRIKTVFISLILTGICVSLFAIGLKTLKSPVFGSASSLLFGFFVAPIYVSANTIVHESVESKFGGRIFSYIGIVMNTGFLIFMFISSFLAEYIDKFWILIACGISLILVGIVSMTAGVLKDTTFSS